MTLAAEMLPNLLALSDSQIDPSLRAQFVAWSDPPTALEILRSLDYCIHGSLGSGFVVKLLELLLDDTIKHEQTTYEAVVARATWRDLAPKPSQTPQGFTGERPRGDQDTSTHLRGIKIT
jgi:hypothetical protein